ncbi:hypothetical protein Hanom_Chr11g01025911 [Helianthus anomalus]
MMITIVWLGLKRGHRVRIGPIAETYWMSPLIMSPLLIVVLVVMVEYIKSGEVKKYVLNQDTIYVPHGSHFLPEQFPYKVNELVINYLNCHKHLVVVYIISIIEVLKKELNSFACTWESQVYQVYRKVF